MDAQEEQRSEEGHSLRQAARANLDARARSKSVKQLAATLIEELIAWEEAAGKRKYRRRSGIDKLHSTVSAFVADLVAARNQPEADGWVFHTLSKESFTGQAVPFRVFKVVVDAWKASKLIEHKPGYTPTVEWEPGVRSRKRGRASRFRATHKLMKACADFGLTGLHPVPKTPS